MQRSKLSGHVDPGRMIHRLEYLQKVVSRTATGHDRSDSVEVIETLRAQKVDERVADESVIVMKETEVQYVYFIHRYRSLIKQDMTVRDEDGVIYNVVGWVDISPRRWTKVKLLRVDQNL